MRALWHEGVAYWEGLGQRSLLSRILLDRPLFDADQWLTVGPVEQVGHACLAGMGQSLAHHAVEGDVEEHWRVGVVVVPDLVVDLLEVPAVLAGLGVERHDRGREQVVAAAHATVRVRPRVTGRQVDHVQLGVERRVHPTGASAELPGISFPGLVAKLARCGRDEEFPGYLAGGRVERGQPAANPAITTRDARVEQPVVVDDRVGRVLWRLRTQVGSDLRFPYGFARLFIQREHPRVLLDGEHFAVGNRHASVSPPTRALGVDVGDVAPGDVARLQVEGKDVLLACRHEHHPVSNDGRPLLRVLGVHTRAVESGHPGALQPLDVARVDLIER